MPLLHWLGKDDALRAAEKTPYRMLKENKDYSYGDENSGNLIIQGDNLEALKALLPYYAGKVKCIYIDPPYNTGNAFEHYDDNLEHSIWLSMMYPRLELLRELLAEDGSLWINLDDKEAHYAKVICDEIFGRKNFVANCIWEKKYSPQNDAKWLSDNHDHILCYAKKKEIWRPNLLPRTEKQNKLYKNPDNDTRGIWMSDNLSVKTYSAANDFPITSPSGRIINPPDGRCWSISQAKLKEMIIDNRIWFGKDGNNSPRIKRFLSEVKQGITALTIFKREEVGDNQEAKREIKEFNSEDVFDTPKPERLLERILTLSSNKGDLILDSFLGSGTTAAVAHKMGRRYIGIEMGNHAKTHCAPRLKKVIEGEQGGISKNVDWQGGGGFRFVELGETIFNELGGINPHIKFHQLAAHIYFTETQKPIPNLQEDNSFLGCEGETAYYLLYNGILGDKRPKYGNVLTLDVFKSLKAFKGKKVIYGEACMLSPDFLTHENITFKQTPYDVMGGF